VKAIRVFGLAGWSGSGKTVLLTQLLPALIARGLTVSTVKHAHHEFDVDQPGKDSWSHRQAGAREVMVASARRWALMHEHRGAREPGLEDLLRHMSPVDLVLVEGFKEGAFPKLEVHRAVLGKPLLYPEDRNIVALACDDAEVPAARLPRFELGDIGGICDLIVAHCRTEEAVDGSA
jgi:molybdopterin-guanine dinucleotide biosynthesis protein B